MLEVGRLGAMLLAAEPLEAVPTIPFRIEPDAILLAAVRSATGGAAAGKHL